MAIFNNQHSTARKDTAPAYPADSAPAQVKDIQANTDFSPAQPPVSARSPAQASPAKESLIAADLTIEGKIEGSGHVRIAGRFKGDVNVQGDLTIENGAKLNGGVRAGKVTVAGELDGNIEAASRVELLESGAINGDLKAESLTVAAGSRIRGHVECGWPDKVSGKTIGRAENDAA